MKKIWFTLTLIILICGCGALDEFKDQDYTAVLYSPMQKKYDGSLLSASII